MAEHGHFNRDPLIICPFNKAHQILKSRMATHIVKCKKSSELSGKSVCPYNASHILDATDMVSHMENCDSRAILDSHKYAVGDMPIKRGAIEILPVENRDIDCEENWDDADAPTYDPQVHVETDRKLLVHLKGSTPAERRHYREERNALYHQDFRSECEESGEDGYMRPKMHYGGSSHGSSSHSGESEECGAEPFAYKKPRSVPREMDYRLAGIGRGAPLHSGRLHEDDFPSLGGRGHPRGHHRGHSSGDYDQDQYSSRHDDGRPGPYRGSHMSRQGRWQQ